MAKTNQPKAETRSPDSQTKSETDTLLEWKNVRYAGSVANAIGMQKFSAVIRSGELIQISLKRWHQSRDVVSMTMGLNAPEDGQVCYLGRCWQSIPLAEQFRLRGQIGRIFSSSAWIQNLTVGDNVRLALTHHGLIDRAKIKSTIGRLAEEIAGPHLAVVSHAMNQRPAFVDPSLLQICQWIRAICVRPRLLILERPLQYLDTKVRSLVAVTINRLLAAGTGVLWLAGGLEDQELALDHPVTRWSLQGVQLQTLPISDSETVKDDSDE